LSVLLHKDKEKEDRQYNDQMKEDRQYNDQVKKDRQYNDQVKEDKRQTMVAKTIHIQLKSGKHEIHLIFRHNKKTVVVFYFEIEILKHVIGN
jgi:hypothetical protein